MCSFKLAFVFVCLLVSFFACGHGKAINKCTLCNSSYMTMNSIIAEVL